jgi:beta-glucosidase
VSTLVHDREPASVDPLQQMTLEEKASLLDGKDFWCTKPVERLGLAAVMLTDGPHGLRKQTGATDHLGLNASEAATCFPPAAGLASSWDEGLLRRVGRALGAEARAQQVGVLLGPGINMKRTPLCGRNFEYLSEDPFLAGRLAAALVHGVQSEGVGTSLKHFAANNQETDRLTVSVEVDERTLREIYLPAFEHVVKDARPWTVMCSYNRINGVYASQHPWLLSTVLRQEWGYDGAVVSDWGAVEDRVAALAAGLDLEMPSSGGLGTAAIVAAVRDGRLAEADVDRAAARVLALIQRAQHTGPAPAPDPDAQHDLAREAAAASAVLLSNNGVLPLNPSEGGRVAVIGELARTPRYQGAGSSRVNPTRVDDALTALQQGLQPHRDVSFSPGYSLDEDAPDEGLVAEAVEQARGSDTVVLFLGLPPAYESEGFDREHLDLPAQQVELLEAVVAAHPCVVVVLSNGSVVTMPWRKRAAAVLECWLLGQAGGSAVADLLLGRTAPRGKLAETIPLRLLDTPAVGAFPGEHDEVVYREGLLVGYRWYDSRSLDVAFPFGHGLTYTTFEYSDLHVDVLDAEAADVEVTVTVSNTGERPGVEIVQLYVADPRCSVFRPEQELKGFRTVELDHGQSQRVTVMLDARAFAWWHVPQQRWLVEGGQFEIRVGASSRDIRSRATIELPGDGTASSPAAGSPVSRWLEHPKSGPLLRERLGDGPFAQMLMSEELGIILGAFPMARLCRLPGFPVAEAELATFGGTDA